MCVVWDGLELIAYYLSLSGGGIILVNHAWLSSVFCSISRPRPHEKVFRASHKWQRKRWLSGPKLVLFWFAGVVTAEMPGSNS